MTKPKPGHQFNSRTYRGKLERELMLGAILIGILIGGGIIALLWGRDAFFAAVGCIALAVGLGGVIFLFLKFLEIISRD
jgi:hypothetical protein